MANIEKFNKEFKPKVVLTAEEMNEVVEKINEIIDLINISIEPVEITHLSSSIQELNLNNDEVKTIYITGLPENNTQMNKIRVKMSGNIELNIIKFNLVNNQLAFNINNTSEIKGNYIGNLEFYIEGREDIKTNIVINVTVD